MTGVSGGVLPWTTDPENPDRTDEAIATPWVSFEVERWYTTDWGTSFALWMPDHGGSADDRTRFGLLS